MLVHQTSRLLDRLALDSLEFGAERIKVLRSKGHTQKVFQTIQTVSISMLVVVFDLALQILQLLAEAPMQSMCVCGRLLKVVLPMDLP